MTKSSNYVSWLESSSWAEAIRESLWLYPALEIVHIIGIVLLVGPALLFDMRLLGYAKSIDIKHLSSYFLPIPRYALLLIIPSGLLLFITNAISLSQDFTFCLKMTLLVLAAVNVLIYNRFTRLFPVKLTATLSILLWIAIIACGRLLAY
jgi:hypothetical protein